MGHSKFSEQVVDVLQSPAQRYDKPPAWNQTVSTGSTLLDLAISGGVTRYGGLPGGIIVQVYGANSTGKTTLMAEVLGSVQRAGGEYKVRDQEARLNPVYCETFGVYLNQDEIIREGTITDVFETLIGPLEEVRGKTVRNTSKAWCPDPQRINIYAVDALAATASRMEYEHGDKLGQRRAKDFSEGFRLVASHIYKHNILMFCTDQVRDNVSGYGEAQRPGGGHAIGFYASLRIRLRKVGDITTTIQLPVGDGKKTITEVCGIEVEAFIKKSSLDRPFRTAPIRLIYNYGIDDIGANLQWLKAHGAMAQHPTDPSKKPGYVVGDRNFVSLDAAIKYVEDNNLEQEIRDMVVDLWNEIEQRVKPNRKQKVR